MSCECQCEQCVIRRFVYGEKPTAEQVIHKTKILAVVLGTALVQFDLELTFEIIGMVATTHNKIMDELTPAGALQ